MSSDGNFEITGSATLDIRLGPLHLEAGISMTLSSRPRFAATAYGSLDFELDLGLFSIDFTIAGFRGEIDITPASAYLAARATVMGITVSGSYLWRFGAPPDISTYGGPVAEPLLAIPVLDRAQRRWQRAPHRRQRRHRQRLDLRRA